MAAKRRPRRSEPAARCVLARQDTHRLVVILLEACERLRASRAILLALAVRHPGRRREPTQQRRLSQLRTPLSLLRAQHCPEPKRAGVAAPGRANRQFGTPARATGAMLLAQQRWLRSRARTDCSRAFAAVAAAADAPHGTEGTARCVATPPVEAAVPFELSPAAARAKFNAWCRCETLPWAGGGGGLTQACVAACSQRWLAPSNLWDESNKECRVVAAQLPFWAFDAVADVRYRGTSPTTLCTGAS